MNYIQFSYKSDYYGFCYNDILLSYSITEVLSLVTQLATKDPRYRHVYQEKERRCVGPLNRKKSLVSIQDVCGPSSFRSWVQRVLVVCENEARNKGPASACMDFFDSVMDRSTLLCRKSRSTFERFLTSLRTERTIFGSFWRLFENIRWMCCRLIFHTQVGLDSICCYSL